MVVAMEDLNQILNWVVVYENRFFHRGGYTPLQLVFEKNP